MTKSCYFSDERREEGEGGEGVRDMPAGVLETWTNRDLHEA